MKKIICVVFSALFLSTVASGVQFGDIREDYTLYSAGDPFAISVATNAYRIALNEVTARSAAIVSATNALNIEFSAELSAEATLRMQGDSTNNALIEIANTKIANVSNSVVAANAKIDANSNLTAFALSTKVNTNDATYLATVSKANTALQSVTITNTSNAVGVVTGSGSNFGIGTNAAAPAIGRYIKSTTNDSVLASINDGLVSTYRVDQGSTWTMQVYDGAGETNILAETLPFLGPYPMTNGFTHTEGGITFTASTNGGARVTFTGAGFTNSATVNFSSPTLIATVGDIEARADYLGTVPQTNYVRGVNVFDLENGVRTNAELVAQIVSNGIASASFTKLYNPTNANEWSEIHGDELWVYGKTPKWISEFNGYPSYTNDIIRTTVESLPYPLTSGVFWYTNSLGAFHVDLSLNVEDGSIEINNTSEPFGFSTGIYSYLSTSFSYNVPNDYDYANIAFYLAEVTNSLLKKIKLSNVYSNAVTSSSSTTNANGLTESLTLVDRGVTKTSYFSAASFNDVTNIANDVVNAVATNLPAQSVFKLHNLYSTNVNSQLFIAASNGVIYVQEVLP